MENSPNVGYTWGKWEQNVIEFIEHWKILSVSYKWLGEKTEVVALPDFGGSEKKLLLFIWKLLDDAEVVVAQNGDAFDIKKLSTRFLQHGILPPSPFKTIDTLKVAKARFAFNSNKLDDMAKDLDEGRKIKHRGFDMWKGCLDNNASDWKAMKRYNKRDVDVLYRLYKRFLPWLKMPVCVYTTGCQNCGSNRLTRHGYHRSKKAIYQRYKCEGCGTWSMSLSGKKAISTNACP